MLFAETLRKLRTERGLSQKELAMELYVTQSTVARWENGSRLPDAEMIFQLAHHLGVDAGMLLSTAAEGGEPPAVIMVEDREIILTGGLSVLREVMPNAASRGGCHRTKSTRYNRSVGFRQWRFVRIRAYRTGEKGCT